MHVRPQSLFPGLMNSAPYQRRWLRGDLIAGTSVAAYLIPQALAYATLAGLSPVAGLWAALPPLLIYAALGSSRQLSVGPESTTALMTAAVVAPLAAGDDVRYASCAAVLAVLVGALCLGAALLRLGFLANLLSEPVLVGYLTGIAVMMVTSQLGRLTGSQSQGLHWPTVALSATSLAVVFALERWAPRVPGPLTAVVVSILLVGVLSLTSSGISVVGELPMEWPTVTFPVLERQDIEALVLPAVGITIVAFSDNVLTARAFAAKTGDEIDTNAELRALGACNVIVGLTQGFPVSSSGSRTALGVASGSATQLYSLVMLAVVAVAVTIGGQFIAMIPSAALGAIVVFAAIKLIDIDQFRRLARFRRSELILAVATTVSVASLGVLQGVLVAVALTVLDLLRRLARAHDSVQGFVPGLAGMHDIDDYPDARQIAGLMVYRYDAPLCFANAENFRKRALAALNTGPEPVRWFVLNAEANVDVDLTALEALDRVRAECERRGVVFAMARVKQDLRDALTAAGLLDVIGEDRLFMTLPTAVAAYERARDGNAPQ
ncbi:sodium-independent anion transporter [Mycobacterium sp. MS1601]|uniref:SulP family inorganic anion transporter n=1 Tax=Mycobacterium sp. MS1601 TaxID=1936029 RepID=UPI000979114F|nr:SulP family inorganic anion transporter [Mycobacterium sp. MS1601]AQA05135.1 sodium-independent anion transporter [Mycobacterium sp. MS1601]